MINVALKKDLSKSNWEKVHEEVAKVESKLKDKGRVLVRASGTEPLIRVMVEGESATEVKKHANQLAKFIEALI